MPTDEPSLAGYHAVRDRHTQRSSDARGHLRYEAERRPARHDCRLVYPVRAFRHHRDERVPALVVRGHFLRTWPCVLRCSMLYCVAAWCTALQHVVLRCSPRGMWSVCPQRRSTAADVTESANVARHGTAHYSTARHGTSRHAFVSLCIRRMRQGSGVSTLTLSDITKDLRSAPIKIRSSANVRSPLEMTDFPCRASHRIASHCIRERVRVIE